LKSKVKAVYNFSTSASKNAILGGSQLATSFYPTRTNVGPYLDPFLAEAISNPARKQGYEEAFRQISK
jgi:hypothetical protein